jgi:D-alanyl-lipoteichoic acid acyltransferase DltB (MBOAT superfamily)
LTLWLTDYVFSPVYKWALSKPRIRSYPLLAMSAALMITMLISGLWHGTTLGFLLFGAVHGLYLVIYRVWDAFLTKRWGSPQLRTWRSRWPVRIAGTALTFNATAFAFIFFQLDATRLSNLLSELV